mgnify:CR=1 FL=1
MSSWSVSMKLFSVLAGQDSFDIRNAHRPNSMYIVGAVNLALSGFALALLYPRVPLFERDFERSVMIPTTLRLQSSSFSSCSACLSC